MVVDKSKIVLTFKHPRIQRETQAAQGLQYFQGVTPHVVNVGILPRSVMDVARIAREGDVVWLWALPMIVVSRKKADVGQQAQITLFCKALAAAKATLVEGCTGRTTASRSQASKMIDEAHRIITKGGKRLPKTGAKPGRKPVEWPSEALRAEWTRKWKSKNFPSDAAVVREAKEAGLSERLIRKLGPSGRNTR